MANVTTLGLQTLAACGPLDENVLDQSTLRVCDVGHRAIAWRDWDGCACPICHRMGTLSGVLEAAFDRERDVIEEACKDEVIAAERDEKTIRDACREARETMRRFLDREETCKLPDAVFGLAKAAYDGLCDAL